MIGGSDIRRVHEMERQARQQAAEAWPEGVIARYLTVAGATVDITAEAKNEREERDEPKDLGNGRTVQPFARKILDLTSTAGCHDQAEYDGQFATVMDRIAESRYVHAAQRWAQAHAEKCRALPRPAVPR